MGAVELGSRLHTNGARLVASRRAQVGFTIVAFLISWALTHLWFYSSVYVGDVPLYRSYGEAIRHGLVPYRDFAVEYPPGALPVFAAPVLLGGAYATGFEWLMAACGATCILIVARCRPHRFALPFLAISPLLIGVLFRGEFDLWPALLLVAAIAALLRDRHALGWSLLAASAAAKLFAVAVVPVAVIWTYRRGGWRAAGRSAAVSVAVIAVIFAPFAALGSDGLHKTVVGQLTRPLQIESLAGSFLMTFAHPVIRSWHSAKSLPEDGAVSAATSAVMLAVLLALWIAFARGGAEPERLKRYGVACVWAFVCFSKVFSPQFLIWLVPVTPLVRGRRGLAAGCLLAAALVNTQIWFPDRYLQDYAWAPQLSLAWLVFLRNVTLVAGLVALAAPAPHRARKRAASTVASAR